MIFVTVGTQLPFPRLMQAMNKLAPRLDEEIIAQTGETRPYSKMEVHHSVAPDRFATFFSRARLVVAHAGIGTVLSARKLNKPLVMVPRRASFKEHRNDHQLATARQMEKRTGVHVVWDLADLGDVIDTTLDGMTSEPGRHYEALLSELRAFAR